MLDVERLVYALGFDAVKETAGGFDETPDCLIEALKWSQDTAYGNRERVDAAVNHRKMATDA